jgi:hypothetical protein
VGADSLLTFSTGNTLRLVNVTLAQLSSGQFVYASSAEAPDDKPAFDWPAGEQAQMFDFGTVSRPGADASLFSASEYELPRIADADRTIDLTNVPDFALQPPDADFDFASLVDFDWMN